MIIIPESNVQIARTLGQTPRHRAVGRSGVQISRAASVLGSITKTGTSASTATPFAGESSLIYSGGGAAYSTVVPTPNMDLNGAWTIELFIEIGATGCIYAGSGGGFPGWNATDGHAWILWDNAGVLTFSFINTSVLVDSVTYSPAPGVTGTFVHIAVGYSGTNISMWLGGTRVVNNVAKSVGVPTQSNAFRLGACAYLPVGTFNGKISTCRWVKSDIYGVGNASITVPSSPLILLPRTVFLWKDPYPNTYNRNIA